MSYSFDTHTIQIPCIDLLNYLINLCDEFNMEYKTYYINKYNPDVFYDWEPSNVSLYNIELDFDTKNNQETMEFVKYLYYKHCDNIMYLESKYVNSIKNSKDEYHEACGFISYVV